MANGHRDGNGHSPAGSIVNTSRIVSIELAGEHLAAVEAWREVHCSPTMEAAVQELVRRALLDEISGIEGVVLKARARLWVDGASGDGEA